jgi:hypothetical protein
LLIGIAFATSVVLSFVNQWCIQFWELLVDIIIPFHCFLFYANENEKREILRNKNLLTSVSGKVRFLLLLNCDKEWRYGDDSCAMYGVNFRLFVRVRSMEGSSTCSTTFESTSRCLTRHFIHG